MSSQVNTTTESIEVENYSLNVHNFKESLMTSQTNELTPVKEQEKTYREGDEAQNVIHISPESEDERVNSGNVSLPMEEHVSYTPVRCIHEECIREEEKNFNREEKNEEDKIKVINNKEAKLSECNVVNEGNEEKDEESDSEDAVLLIGCVKSANEAIELVRKCQRNYNTNHCHLDRVDGNDDDSGKDDNSCKYDSNKFNCLETINHEQRARELETLIGSQCAKTNTKRAHSPTYASVEHNNTKAAKNNRSNKHECHDLPITLQEFAEQAQCSVSLFVTRSAVFADALTGFTNEAQREQREELRLRELYMEQLQEEQRERVYWEQEEEEHQLARPKVSSLQTNAPNNNREKLHKAQKRENKMESNDISKGKEANTVKSLEHTSVMASESPHNKGEVEEETLQMSSCTAAAQLSAKQQYFLFMKDKLSQNKSTPYFLRHKYPVYERYSFSTSGLGTNAQDEILDLDDQNKCHGMERRTNRIVIGNDQVAREWRFVWKQFKRDIAREVFIVQESVLNNADDAAVIVLSYLEYAFDRGSADVLVRHSIRMKSLNGQEAKKSSPCNSLSLQSSSPSTTTTTMTTTESTSWEEASSFATNGDLHASANNTNNASPTRIRNRDVWRSLLSVGGAAVKDALAHAQAALPEFVVEPIRDVITQMKSNNNNNNNNSNTESFACSTSIANSNSSNSDNMTQNCGTRSTLSRLREMWQARIEGREIKSIYPRSIKEKGRKVFAAAREVVLAGQQSFLAFPYMLLYEQIGMHALACATPLPSRNVTSSDDDEIGEENAEVGEDNSENTDNKGQMKDNAEKECSDNKTISSEHVEIKADDESKELCSKSTESENSQQAEIYRNTNEIATSSNISGGNNKSNKKDSFVLEKLEEDDDENDWSVLDDLEKLSLTKKVARSKIQNVAEIRNAKKKHHYQDSQNRTHHFKRNEPLMIGEPAVCDLHKFCEHIRKKIQRKDSMNGYVNVNKSLFREDIDGSVFLIPTYSSSESVSPSDKSEIHNTNNVKCEQNTEEQKQEQEQEQVKPSHKRGTRIHLYYSSSRGVPVVCVSKLFRLYTISQSTKIKTEIYKSAEIKSGASEVNKNGAGENNASKNVEQLSLLLLMQMTFTLFTEDEVEIRWKWFTL